MSSECTRGFEVTIVDRAVRSGRHTGAPQRHNIGCEHRTAKEAWDSSMANRVWNCTRFRNSPRAFSEFRASSGRGAIVILLTHFARVTLPIPFVMPVVSIACAATARRALVKKCVNERRAARSVSRSRTLLPLWGNEPGVAAPAKSYSSRLPRNRPCLI